MQFRTTTAMRPSLNVAPLIDMVLLLLIFFAISSSFVVQTGLKVELPDAGAPGQTNAKELSVTIDNEESVYFGPTRTTLEELGELIRASVEQRHQESFLVVKADRGVRHGLVVTVMDIARQSGVRRLAIATRPGRAAP